jgi:hypothetical protein
MSDGGRERASPAVEVWNSFQKRSAQRSAVRSIAWLGPLLEPSCAFVNVPDLLKNLFLNFRRILNTDPFRAQ